MKLTDTFKEAIRHTEKLVAFYEMLLTKNTRACRRDWSESFFEANLVEWPRRQGLWRSRNDNVLIVGTGKTTFSHRMFMVDGLSVLLKSGLILAMAAVDKILHDAICQKFASLAKNGSLNDLVHMKLSNAYEIAHSARVRRGKGGKKRPRPGHKIKEEVMRQIYTQSYLAPQHLQKICAICGKKSIFTKYVKSRPTSRITPTTLQEKWERLYIKRNQIAHECDIIRKPKPQKVHFHEFSGKEMLDDIRFIGDFGHFLARILEK